MEKTRTAEQESRLDYGVPATPRGSRAARVVCGIVLVLLILPAAFGFLASFEAFPNAVVWRIGYATFGLACLVLGTWLILKKK
jgi:hypothetical protein